ncbi:MAG: MlaD family protein [Chthoniobacter sp.]|nr:MlaD family protein [Chthoniobacter sp.]
MNILRNEIRTGLLVVVALGVLVAVLLYLGAPGVFVPQHTYRIYFDNAGGIKPGAQVLLAGRKIGQVRRLFSPVPEKERPTPKMETLIEVQVDRDAKIYQKVKAQMTQNSVLGESVIDFTNGEESSGLADDGASFLGERPGGLADAVPAVLEKIDPALAKVTTTLDSLQKTADNLTRLTADGADLPLALAHFKRTGSHLEELTGERGSLHVALKNIETITAEDGKLGKTLDQLTTLTGPESAFARTLENAEKFTASLTNNRDVEVSLRNFRQASESLNRTVRDVGTQFSSIGQNLEQATDTVKHQPWRLIWPGTKKYDEPTTRATPPPRRVTPKKAPPRR